MTQSETFWRGLGAQYDNGLLTGFGDPRGETAAAANGGALKLALGDLGLIRVAGDDAVAFLQGQFSNDIRALGQGHQLHAYCNAQGRMLGLMRAFARGEAIYLQAGAALVEALVKRLRMFVMRSKVTLDAATDLGQMGLRGDGAGGLEAMLAGLKLPQPRPGATDTANDVTVLRLAAERAVLIAPWAQIEKLWQSLDARAAGMPAWRLLDIRAGVPQLYPQTLEAFVPQMLNLDALGGISFTKGCYPGQEIVARTHYLGRLKQRLYRARVDTPAAPGDTLYAPNFGTQAAGTVVDAVRVDDTTYELTASIQMSSAEAGDVRLKGPEGPRLTLLPLPYELPAEAKPRTG